MSSETLRPKPPLPVKELEPMPEQKEYGYREGVEAILQRVDELLKKQEYVTISIIGSSNDVGKTRISGEIAGKLLSAGRLVSSMTEMYALVPQYVSPYMGVQTAPGHILIFHADSPSSSFLSIDPKEVPACRERQDKALRQRAKDCNIPLTGIDIRVLIFREDKPPQRYERLYADILINNELAVNK